MVMSATGLGAFDKTVQTTNLWLDIANVRCALSKPVHRLWPGSAADLEVQATEQHEQTLERTEP